MRTADSRLPPHRAPQQARVPIEQTLRLAARHQSSGHHQEAAAQAQCVLDAYPQHARALLLAGQSMLMLGEHEQCVEILSRLIRLQPCHAIALSNRGAALEALGDLERALCDYESAIRVEPEFSDALLNRAHCLHKIGQYEAAVKAFEAILRLAPRLVEALVGLGEALRKLVRRDESLSALSRATTLEPDNGGAWSALGNAHLDFGNWEQAIAAYGQASSLLPGSAITYSNCAKALRELRQFEDALLVCDAALAIDANCLPAWRNKSVLMLDLGQWALAIEACSEVLKRKSDDAQALNNLGFALGSLRKYDAALDAYQQACQCQPDLTVARFNQACTLELLYRHEEALPCYAEVARLNPHYPNLLGRSAHARHYICDWSETASLRTQIVEQLSAGHTSCDPFRVITLSDRAEVQRDLARRWLSTLRPPIADFPPLKPIPRRPRIRIGYFSADFHQHATTMLMGQLLELHDRSRFELIAFSFGERREDDMKRRMRQIFDGFHDVLALSDDQVAQMARDMELDIAVDLKGHTKDNRLGVFQRRVAPVQISYLGYPGTLGAPFMDYIVADHVVIPDELRPYYDEKVIRVPGSYQANDARRRAAEYRPTRAELGLPRDAFVFCSFNNAYKITPEVFDVWMRLLTQVPDSVIWLLADTETAQNNLRREASARGVAASRLIFAPRIPTEAHWARQPAADLFLDTLPCNAHTTASDALRMGLPVLTCTGTSFASRVAASLLHAQGLAELVTADLVAYEQQALALATDAALQHRIRRQAEEAVTTGRLFNTEALVRALERGYEMAMDRAWAGLAPEHLDV